MIADQVPPTSEEQREKLRKVQRRGKNDIKPRREECAATMLRDLYLARGGTLTMFNATRIIEQARGLNDEMRGISSQERQNIEQAKAVVGPIHRSKDRPVSITKRERQIIHQAYAIIRRTPVRSPRDQELIDQIQAIQERVKVH